MHIVSDNSSDGETLRNTAADTPSRDDQIARALRPHLRPHPQASDDGLSLLVGVDDAGGGEGRP